MVNNSNMPDKITSTSSSPKPNASVQQKTSVGKVIGIVILVVLAYIIAIPLLLLGACFVIGGGYSLFTSSIIRTLLSSLAYLAIAALVVWVLIRWIKSRKSQ